MPTLRPTPDERLENNVIPLRIDELRRMAPSRSVTKRINALLTRLGTPAAGASRAEKKAFVSPLPLKVMDGKVELGQGIIPPNVMAGLLKNKSQEEAGYSPRYARFG